MVPGPVRARTTELFVQWAPRGAQRLLESWIDLPIPRYVRSRRLLFIHIPKNAGTTIAVQLYGRPIAHRTAEFYLKSDPSWYTGMEVFAVSRNPHDRLVSAFEFTKQEGLKSQIVNRAFARALHKYATFDEFVTEYLLPRKNHLDRLDPMLRSQSSYVTGPHGKNLVKRVFRYEEPQALSDFLQKAGTPIDLSTVINKSVKRQHWASYYNNAQVAQAVRDIYRMDFERFQYDPSI